MELVVFLTCLLHKTTHCSYLNLRDSYYDPHMDDAILAAEAEMRAISETDKRAYDAGKHKNMLFLINYLINYFLLSNLFIYLFIYFCYVVFFLIY